jgi:hypothetical protein
LSEIERPWQAGRNHLESVVISKDCAQLRDELIEIVRNGLLQ